MLDNLCKYDSLQPHTINIRNPAQTQYFDFQFPTRFFQTTLFRQPNDLTLDLVRLGLRLYFWRGRVFDRQDFVNQAGSRIVFKCKNKQCSARLIYHKKLNQQFMQCIVFNNLHRHKKSSDPDKAKKQQINQFIMHLRGQQYQEFRKVPKWVNKFDVTNTQGLYIIQQVYWYNCKGKQVLTALAFHNRIVRRVTQGDQTLLIFVRSQTMKQSYLQFGQTLTMQLFYEKVKKRVEIAQKYAIGYFFGQDGNMSLSLLGLFFIMKQTKQSFKKLFQIFFQTTCQKMLPKCIITDQRQQIRNALSELKEQNKYTYHHLYPWYHMAPRIKNKLKQINPKEGKHLMDLMCQAMQQNNQQTFYSLMCQIKTQLKNKDEQFFQSFKANEQLCCFRRIPKVFSGFAISTVFGQKVLGQVNNSAVYRAHTNRLFHRLLKIQNHLKFQAQKIYKINQNLIKYCPQQINELPNIIQEKIMEIIVRAYSQSQECLKQFKDQITIKVKQKNGKKFICKFLLQFDHWECQCSYLVLTGLPCCHLISVLLDNKIKGSLLYYINSRWIHDKQQRHVRPLRGALITNKRRRP